MYGIKLNIYGIKNNTLVGIRTNQFYYFYDQFSLKYQSLGDLNKIKSLRISK